MPNVKLSLVNEL